MSFIKTSTQNGNLTGLVIQVASKQKVITDGLIRDKTAYQRQILLYVTVHKKFQACEVSFATTHSSLWNLVCYSEIKPLKSSLLQCNESFEIWLVTTQSSLWNLACYSTIKPSKSSFLQRDEVFEIYFVATHSVLWNFACYSIFKLMKFSLLREFKLVKFILLLHIQACET